jgi:hypothetical protein
VERGTRQKPSERREAESGREGGDGQDIVRMREDETKGVRVGFGSRKGWSVMAEQVRSRKSGAEGEWTDIRQSRLQANDAQKRRD